MTRQVQIYLHNGHFPTLRERIPVGGIIIDRGVIHRILSRGEKPPRNIESMDLHGAFVIPGFIDSHTHLISRGIEMQRIDLARCSTFDDCLEKLRSGLSQRRSMLFGSNYDETTWSDHPAERMTRKTLDRISTKIPIIMRRICGHFAVVNTAALKNIPREWEIADRRQGWLYKQAALHLNDIFPPTAPELRRAVDLGMHEAVQAGVTSAHEIASIERFRLLQQVHTRGKLRLRFSVYILHRHFERLRAAGLCAGFGDDMLRFGGIKIFMDGSVGARTAAFSRPYRGTAIRGTVMMSPRTLAHTVRTAQQEGYQLMIHAIGDRAVSQALEVLRAHIPDTNPLHHRLEHVELLDDRSMRIMAQKNIIASMQPNFVRRWQGPDGLYAQYLGSRSERMNRFRAMRAAGIRIIFGSDCMPTGPLYGMRGAYAHPFRNGRISRHAALTMYTRAGAFATHEQMKKGRIAQGFLADLAILDRDPLRPQGAGFPQVLMTMVGGITVYRRPSRADGDPVAA